MSPSKVPITVLTTTLVLPIVIWSPIAASARWPVAGERGHDHEYEYGATAHHLIGSVDEPSPPDGESPRPART
jgi:hypothetical protein